MPTITVRISEEDKRRLLRQGALSKSVREALELYFNSRKSKELIEKLDALQRKNPIRTTPADEARLIREDRER